MSNKYLLQQWLLRVSVSALCICLLMTACKKPGIAIPPQVLHFPSDGGTYIVLNDTSTVYHIQVLVSTVSGKDRTVNYKIVHSTATQGQQYTITSGNGTVTIPADSTYGLINVKGIYAGYNSSPGRIDTLVIALDNGSIAASDIVDTFTLRMRQYCPVVLADLQGPYQNTYDDGAYGPYTTAVVPVSTTGTTGQIKIQNFYNAGFNDLVFNLDWTDPANFKVTFDAQNTGADGSIFGSSYAGQAVWIYPGDTDGTFSSCEQTITVNYYIVLQPSGLSPGAEQTILSR